jgi:hypothetical protein
MPPVGLTTSVTGGVAEHIEPRGRIVGVSGDEIVIAMVFDTGHVITVGFTVSV